MTQRIDRKITLPAARKWGRHHRIAPPLNRIAGLKAAEIMRMNVAGRFWGIWRCPERSGVCAIIPRFCLPA
jgi:hypothetical protein